MAFESHPRPTADQMTWFIGDMEQSVQLHPGQVYIHYSSLVRYIFIIHPWSDIYSLFIPGQIYIHYSSLVRYISIIHP